MTEGATIKQSPWYLRLLVMLSCLGNAKSLVGGNRCSSLKTPQLSQGLEHLVLYGGTWQWTWVGTYGSFCPCSQAPVVCLLGPDLSCNVSVKHRITAGKCLVNGYLLLQIDNESQDTLLHQLMKGENATKACRDLPSKMNNILEESSKITGDHTINVTMHSQYNQGELIDPRWAIAIDGQPPIYFYPSNKTWRWSHPDASSTVKQWEANSDLTQDLSTLSNGDFRKCLRVLPTHLTEKPSSTIKTLDGTQVTSATQTASATQYLNTTAVVLLCIVGGIIITGVLI